MGVDKLMGFCGLSCASCPIYLATRETDKAKQRQMRIQIAELISEHYDTPVTPEDVNDCDGCRSSTGRLYSGCNNCEIRNCAQTKNCLTCAHCDEYPCEKLETIFASDPDAKKQLDKIRSHL